MGRGGQGGRAGFLAGGGPGGGGGRGGTLISPGFGPIRCGRFGVRNARVVKKVGEKEIPLCAKETPLGEKVTKVGEKVNFVGEKKYIVLIMFGHCSCLDAGGVVFQGLFLILLAIRSLRIWSTTFSGP